MVTQVSSYAAQGLREVGSGSLVLFLTLLRPWETPEVLTRLFCFSEGKLAPEAPETTMWEENLHWAKVRDVGLRP